jgi:geranylgeranyl diphosphate synthase type II
LCIAAAETLGGAAEQVMPTACALELIHAFSLVHDDLPAMDNDRLRRGQPTVWVKYGEAMAILAGDALFAKAFELLAEQARLSPPERVAQVIHLIATASGVQGMCGGQVEDILCEGQAVSAEQLRFIHTHKTGALIRASVLSGALLMGADEPTRKTRWTPTAARWGWRSKSPTTSWTTLRPPSRWASPQAPTAPTAKRPTPRCLA